MGALRAAQWQFDEELPPSVSESPQDAAEQAWISNGVPELIARRDYLFPLKGKQVGVGFERFALAVDEFVMSELGAQGASQTVLGRLVLAALAKSSSEAAAAAQEMFNAPSHQAVLEQLAIDLLTPFAREGVLAQAEAEL